jgi:mutator protein MutT
LTGAKRYPVVGVGGVVIRDGRALLIRRGTPPLQGRWSIPGGRVEWGETIEQAVLRELREETGLEARAIELIEVVERIFDDEPNELNANHPRPSSGAQYHFILLDFLCAASNGEAHAGGDAREIAWAAEEELDRFDLNEAAARVTRKAFAYARKLR